MSIELEGSVHKISKFDKWWKCIIALCLVVMTVSLVNLNVGRYITEKEQMEKARAAVVERLAGVNQDKKTLTNVFKELKGVKDVEGLEALKERYNIK